MTATAPQRDGVTSVLVLQGKQQQTTNRNNTHRGTMRKMNETLKHRHHYRAYTNEQLPELLELTLCGDPIHAIMQCPRVDRRSGIPTRPEAHSTSTAIASPNYNCEKFDLGLHVPGFRLRREKKVKICDQCSDSLFWIWARKPWRFSRPASAARVCSRGAVFFSWTTNFSPGICMHMPCGSSSNFSKHCSCPKKGATFQSEQPTNI